MTSGLSRGYRRARNGMLLFLLGLFVLGFAVFRYSDSPTDHAYPIYSWSLFRSVPPRIYEAVDIRIIAVGGKQLPEPVLLKDAAAYVAHVPFGDYNSPHMKFSRGLESGDDALIEQAREALESRFLVDRVVYEVVELRYDVIERWRTGKYDEMRVLATYTSGI